MTLLVNFEPVPAHNFPEGITYAHQECETGIWPVVVKRQNNALYILPNDGRKRAMIKVALQSSRAVGTGTASPYL